MTPFENGTPTPAGDLVALTGGTGFIAGFLISALLDAGWRVRASVQTPEDRPEVVDTVLRHGSDPSRLDLVEARLEADRGWDALMDGARYAHHVASPLPLRMPRSPEALVRPAVDGTRRVLAAAARAGVERVVLTSSSAAIAYGHRPQRGTLESPFTEEDWTFLDGSDVNAYVASKALAEREAWRFAAEHPGSPELSVVNPVAVVGPVLGRRLSSSTAVVNRLLSGGTTFWPRVSLNIVDVRDVAELHMLAMTSPAAARQRFIAAAGDPVSFEEIAAVIRQLPEFEGRIGVRQLPDSLVVAAGSVFPSVSGLASTLGRRKHLSHAKAQDLLGFAPRSVEEAVSDCARSLLAARAAGRIPARSSLLQRR